MNDLDRQIVDLRKRRDMLVCYDRLRNNPDFHKVINDFYLERHPLSLVMQKGQIPLSEETNVGIDRQLDAVAMFKMYLLNLSHELPDIELKIEEAMALREQQTRNT